MTDEKEGGGKKRQRSPNYPAICLRDAVGRVGVLYKEDGRAGAPMETAVKHFGFGGMHGQALTIVSALKKFGLIEDRNGRIIPTPQAIHIIEFGLEHQRGAVAIREAALKPEIYAEIVDQYREHGRLPSDESLRPELITDKGFNPKAVDGFLADFRGSLEFAGLLEGNTLKLSQASDGSPIASSETEAKDEPSDKTTLPPVRKRDVQAGTKEAVFPLDHGQVLLQWPEHISPDEIEDFEGWMQLMIRKVKRAVQQKSRSAEAADES